jgi:hypothetical protein
MRNLGDEQARLDQTRREIAMLTVAGMRDNLSPAQREFYREAEMSARAEAKLRRKGIADGLYLASGRQGNTGQRRLAVPPVARAVSVFS